MALFPALLLGRAAGKVVPRCIKRGHTSLVPTLNELSSSNCTLLGKSAGGGVPIHSEVTCSWVRGAWNN